jgi:hypothetical protein
MGECVHFSSNMCPIYTHDGASAQFSTKSHETDYSISIKHRFNLILFNLSSCEKIRSFLGLIS